jgi:hypothetical protein
VEIAAASVAANALRVGLNVAVGRNRPVIEFYYQVHNGTDGGSSNNVGGVWIVEVPAVPEPSTWAMLLIGFAGIGFTTYRRSSRRQLPTAVM